MFGNHIVNLVTGDEQSISELVKNLKKIIAFTLASEPELQTRNLKVTSANDIVTHINEQLTKLLFNDIRKVRYRSLPPSKVRKIPKGGDL